MSAPERIFDVLDAVQIVPLGLVRVRQQTAGKM
jgi:hypothetical protein